jgi:hypothetical protein
MSAEGQFFAALIRMRAANGDWPDDAQSNFFEEHKKGCRLCRECFGLDKDTKKC